MRGFTSALRTLAVSAAGIVGAVRIAGSPPALAAPSAASTMIVGGTELFGFRQRDGRGLGDRAHAVAASAAPVRRSIVSRCSLGAVAAMSRLARDRRVLRHRERRARSRSRVAIVALVVPATAVPVPAQALVAHRRGHVPHGAGDDP